MKGFGRWKSFDFGPESSVDNTEENILPTKLLTKSLDNGQTSENKVSLLNLQKKIVPKSVADLAIHTKKIQELQGWLKFSLSPPGQEKKCTPILLLSGPTGSGKTITLQVISKELNVALIEWVNPVDIDYEVGKGSSQRNRFLEFFHECKYSSLFDIENNNNIILVKDFPNVFVRNPDEFHSVLDEIYFKGTHPVVFICTEFNSGTINLQRNLFPEEILIKYSITHFSFNACAPTLLRKAIKRAQSIFSDNSNELQSVSSNTIDAIIASSLGDIRTAMNQLYLASFKDSEDRSLMKTNKEKQGTKRKRNSKTEAVVNIYRDVALGLFHGLGRVLNPKRIERGGSWRISCDINQLVDEFSTQPAKFNAFLYENYLKYFSELDDVENAIEILSSSAQLMENWEHHEIMVMALWMCVLGLMTFNEHKVSKWNQIKGPRKIENAGFSKDSVNFNSEDKFYYNIITKSNKYYKFNCD
ncbi:cell cycle checkpoint protein RAD17 [Cylas formicarius]|uniref:cell cycle checkpoint protein RAD17 n=1 Tax=Cylas formicarius TaxID=197179 RepID=UPI002958377F|nr:cell cycle checkpoint protein RAD17 [Cylas formicarius]